MTEEGDRRFRASFLAQLDEDKIERSLSTVDVDRLTERYARACNLQQPVNKAQIEKSLLRWASKIGAPAETRIVFVRSHAEADSAIRAVQAAWNVMLHREKPRAARAASSAVVASFGTIASSASVASAARAAAWTTNAWELSYASQSLIGAAKLGNSDLTQRWLPILEAFEAGAFLLWVTDAVIYVAPIPSVVVVDRANRLHCETGPAFEWLSDIKSYYWRGAEVPSRWISRRIEVTAAEVFREANAEVRRAGCEIIGWDKVLDQIDARLIDEDGDPQIGTLYEGTIPGLDLCGFLKVTCGTGRTFVIPTPAGMKTAIEAQAWIQNVPVAQWIPPEVRG